MFFTIGYTVITLLYIAIFIYRIRRNTFSSYLKEEIGLIAIFFIISPGLKVPGILKAIYISITLLVFIYGCTKNYKK